MLYSEFYERTGVSVDAKEAAKKKEAKAKLHDTLHHILYSLGKGLSKAGWDYSRMPLTVNFLPKKYLGVLEKVGISLEMTYRQAMEYGYPSPRHYRIDETSYEIKKYLNIV